MKLNSLINIFKRKPHNKISKIKKINQIDKIKIETQNYTDIHIKNIAKNNRLKVILISISGSIILFSLSLVILNFRAYERVEQIKFKLVPSIDSTDTIYTLKTSNGYATSLFSHVASILGNWDYENYNVRIENMFEHYFSQDLIVLQRENIRKNDFVSKVNENKFTSIFVEDKSSSRVKWCEQINSACGYINGEEIIYQNGKIFSTTFISYFMIASIDLPQKPNSHIPLQLIRVIRANPEKSDRYLHAAEKGHIPDADISMFE